MKLQNYINHDNISLLDSLSKFKNDLSKKTIKNYLKNKMITVNNQVITNGNYLLKDNDFIEITYDKKIIPDYNLEIIYEDEYLIAINKPSGLLSISNEKEKVITAYRMISDYVKKEHKGKYIFVVHRLDQDTSGILLFAKDEKIRDIMQDNWNNLVKKRGYLAIVDGKLIGSKTIKSYLYEDHNGFIHSSKSNQGKLAITHYEVLKNNHKYSLLQVFIDTGRRNQIRVHLSEMGYPITGDKKYKCLSNPIKRLCLHANLLEFIHPVTKKIITLKTNIPDEMNKLI